MDNVTLWMIDHAYTYGIAIYLVCLIIRCVANVMVKKNQKSACKNK